MPCWTAGNVGLGLSLEGLPGHGRELSPWEGLVEEWGRGSWRLLGLETCWTSPGKSPAEGQSMR